MRADAVRNRERILASARDLFSTQGSEASLDEVAKRAGVGPGTLYRHFPTREDLISALMQDWQERVVANAEQAAASGADARQVLMGWFEQFVRDVTLHAGAAARLSNAVDDPTSPLYGKCQALIEGNRLVLSSLAERGLLRAAVEDRQVFRLLAGVGSVVDRNQLTDADLRSMLGIVVDGLVRDPG